MIVLRIIGRIAQACADEPALLATTVFALVVLAWATVQLLRAW